MTDPRHEPGAFNLIATEIRKLARESKDRIDRALKTTSERRQFQQEDPILQGQHECYLSRIMTEYNSRVSATCPPLSACNGLIAELSTG